MSRGVERERGGVGRGPEPGAQRVIDAPRSDQPDGQPDQWLRYIDGNNWDETTFPVPVGTVKASRTNFPSSVISR